MNDDTQDSPELYRETVFPPPELSPAEAAFQRFKIETGNEHFTATVLTWITLAVLLVGFPLVSLLSGDNAEALRKLKDYPPIILSIILLVSAGFEWVVFFGLVYGTSITERTGLAGLQLRKFMKVDLLWAVAFLLGSNLILSGLSWLLGKAGLEVPGEVRFLIPQDPVGRVVWAFMSFTAGFTEEIAFRGYLMTRLRLVGRFNSWVIPTIVSSAIFGVAHGYEGVAGMILITVYGAMFALMYIRTQRLWPGIIAHSLHDFSAIFWPY